MDLARAERHGFCDTLLRVGPEAPTLCRGWNAWDLAADLWVRENDYQAFALMMLAREHQLRMRRAAAKTRLSFPEMVADLRHGPRGLPAVDALEFFIHHEDLRRAGPRPLPPREFDEATEAWFWRELKRAARRFYRRSPFGVDLQTPDGLILPVKRHRKVSVTGRPSELVLFSAGRTGSAEVRIQGDPVEVSRLEATLGI